MLSPDAVVIRIHPLGVVQDAGTKIVLVATSVLVLTVATMAVGVEMGVSVMSAATVNVAVGKFSEMVGGMGVGVACDGKVSARASEMPPITRITERRAMMTPLPSCRKGCIISPWPFWRGAGAR